MAILSIVGLAMSQLIDNGNSALAQLRDDNDRRELRNYLNASVDCGKTKTAYPTCSTSSIALMSKANKVLVAANGTTQFGKWVVRANCSSGKLTVEVKNAKRGGFAPLYSKIPFSCSY